MFKNRLRIRKNRFGYLRIVIEFTFPVKMLNPSFKKPVVWYLFFSRSYWVCTDNFSVFLELNAPWNNDYSEFAWDFAWFFLFIFHVYFSFFFVCLFFGWLFGWLYSVALTGLVLPNSYWPWTCSPPACWDYRQATPWLEAVGILFKFLSYRVIRLQQIEITLA